MNIFNELKAFRDWSIVNLPTTGETALWYSLININNMAGWSEWFSAANPTLELMTGLSKSSLDRSRNKLVQRGLIEYQKGTTRQAGSYRLVSLWDQSRVQSRGQSGSNVRLIRDQSGSNSGNINIHRHNITETREYPPAPPEGENTPVKINFAEFVYLTEAEHQDLVSLLGVEKTAYWINALNLWKGSKDKKTRSDYYTIMNWDRREKEKQKENAAATTGTTEREIYLPPEHG